MPRQPNLTYQCQGCGETVQRYVRPIRLETFGQPKYCGNKCYQAAQKGKSRSQRTTFIIDCSCCGKTFQRWASRSPHSKDYSSRECQRKALTSPEGTRRNTPQGYWMVRVDNHPHAKSSAGNLWIMEHRLVKEKQLLRDEPNSEFLLDGYLRPDCHVHHINAVRSDNREENLQAMWPSDHHSLLKGRFTGEGNTETHRRCTSCGEVKAREEFPKSKNAAGGTFHQCKPCNAKRCKDRREKLKA